MSFRAGGRPGGAEHGEESPADNRSHRPSPVSAGDSSPCFGPSGDSAGLGMTGGPYPIIPGGIPFIILPNFLAPKPLEKLRIIFFICRYCFRS